MKFSTIENMPTTPTLKGQWKVDRQSSIDKTSLQMAAKEASRHPPRFLVTYQIAAKTYQITLPGVSSFHVRQSWDRPGSTLLRVEECDANGLPV